MTAPSMPYRFDLGDQMTPEKVQQNLDALASIMNGRLTAENFEVSPKNVQLSELPATDEVPIWSGTVWVADKLFSNNFRQNAWTPYTPALTASGSNPTLGSASVASGRWTRQVDRLIHANVLVKFGTSGVAAGTGTYRISLPVNSVATDVPILGQGYAFDSSTSAYYLVTCEYVSATTLQMVVETASLITDASPVVWAASDYFSLHLAYEAAS